MEWNREAASSLREAGFFQGSAIFADLLMWPAFDPAQLDLARRRRSKPSGGRTTTLRKSPIGIPPGPVPGKSPGRIPTVESIGRFNGRLSSFTEGTFTRRRFPWESPGTSRKRR